MSTPAQQRGGFLPHTMLTEAHVNAAFDWMLANSDIIGAARGMQIRTEYQVGQVRARLMRASQESSADKRRAEAEAADDYAIACEKHAQAEAEWERLRDQRNKCELIIEAWRSIQANERGLQRFTR
jgi:hypothetical protein